MKYVALGTLLGFAAFLALRCSNMPEPTTAAGYFRQACIGAVVLEAQGEQHEVTQGVLKLCDDPELPGRIVKLLMAVHEVGQSITQTIQLVPAPPDAGAP